MTDRANVETVLSYYLYGSGELPDLRYRLRDLPPEATFDRTVATSEYMASVGRFSYPSYFKVVQDFFAGAISRTLGQTDDQGVTRLSLYNYVSQTGHDDDLNYTLSQYSMRPDLADFQERAFIWGTNPYHINERAVLVWDGGDLRIENLLVEPKRDLGADENFDFVGSPSIQYINEHILEPTVDPYGIGRRINFEFDNSEGVTIDVYTQANYLAHLAQAESDAPSPIDLLFLGAQAQDLLTALSESEVIEHSRDGRLIVYGSMAGETIDQSSVRYVPAGANVDDFGLAVVAGGGNDIISGTDLSDLIYGGGGRDEINGGDGADQLYGDDEIDIINGGDGEDTIFGGAGADILDGGAGFDAVDFSEETQGIRLTSSTDGRWHIVSDDPAVASDTMSNFEAIIGSDLADDINLSSASTAADIGATVNAGAGNDLVRGGAGDDIIQGASGEDHLYGGGGWNRLSGGEGNDELVSQGTGDIVAGGADNDLIKLTSDRATVKFGVGDGKDVVQTGEGDYQLSLNDLTSNDIEIIAGGTDFVPTSGHPVRFQADFNILVIRIKSTGEQISFIKQANVDALFDGMKARDGVTMASNSAMFGDTIDQDGPYKYRLDEGSLKNSPISSIRFSDGSEWTAKDIWSKVANYENETGVSFDVFKPSGRDFRPGLLPSEVGADSRLALSVSSLIATSTPSERSGFHDPVGYVAYLNSTYFENAPLPYPAGENIVGAESNYYLDDSYGNDILAGGPGEDGYHLTFGDDTVVWNIGDGDDRVEGTGGYFGNDVLALGEGITPSDLRFAVTDFGTSLAISVDNVGGSITLMEQVGALVDRGAFSISFHDGTVWSHADVLAAASDAIAASHQYVEGSSGDDFLGSGWGYQPFVTNFTAQGREGDDVITVDGDGGGTIIFAKGDGHDTLKAHPGTAYRDFIRSDTLSLADILPSEVTLRRAGDALIVTVTATGDAFVVQDQFVDRGSTGQPGVSQIVFGDHVTWTRSDILAAVPDGNGDDAMVGGGNSDWLFGGGGNDVLVGGSGNDTLDGGSDDDVYRFSLGDGQDRIREDSGVGGGGSDTIEFTAGISAGDIVVSQENGGAYLVLGIAGSSDSIKIERAITDSDARVETVRFADGTVWSFADLMAQTTSGTWGTDFIYGSELSETISGGWGDDFLYGRGGGDIYRFGIGDGFDTIFADGPGDQDANDAIEFGAGIASNSVTVRQGSGGYDLILTVAGGGQITISDGIDYRDCYIEEARFADGTVWSFADMMALSHVATAGNDRFYGSVLTDTLSGEAGNDVLVGRDGNDVLIGGTGNDTLDGGGDSDIYRFSRGDGQDVIQEHELDRYGNTDGEDTIEFAAGICVDDVTVSQADYGTDLLLQIAGSSDSILIDGGIKFGYWDSEAEFGHVEKVQFADGTVWSFADMLARAMAPTAGDDTIYGSNLPETLSGGAGNDELIGGGGDDTYRFGRGDGQDVVFEYGNDDHDALEFSIGVAPGDVVVSQADSGGNMVFHIAGTSDQITIYEMNPEEGSTPTVEAVRFADGTVWSFADVITRATAPTIGNDAIYGSYLNETLLGGGGDDVVSGRGGNDVIIGGAGNDHLSGDGGNDIYRFALGDGQDVIEEDSTMWGTGGGNDTVQFDIGIAPSDIVVTESSDGQSLILSIAGTSDSLELFDTMGDGTNRIEQIHFADATMWSHLNLVDRVGASSEAQGLISDHFDGWQGSLGGNKLLALSGTEGQATGWSEDDYFVFHSRILLDSPWL